MRVGRFWAARLAAKVDRNKSGIFNESNTEPAEVICNIGYSPHFGEIRFTFYDRHASQNVSCNARIVASDGAVYWEHAVATSGFSSDDMDRYLTPPAGSDSGILILECTLPPQTSNGYSYVSSVRFQK